MVESGRHPELAAFASGRDQRQLHARDTRLSATSPLRFMREGEAERLRAECRAGDLICPVPGCVDPRYTTVGGMRRDHFRHLSLAGGVHAPETYHHFMGKQIVGAWARQHYPQAVVNVDDRQVRSADGLVQVPDVLVELPDGRRFAFEIQFAALTIPEWRRRHDGYRQQGIVDVWLWGHEPRYQRPSRHHAGRIELGPVPFAAQRAGVPLHWINPDEGLIATCRGVSDPWTQAERHQGRRGKATWETVALAFESLAECLLEGDRFVTPLQRYEMEQRPQIARDLLKRRGEERKKRAAKAKAKEDEARKREEKRAYAQRMADEEYERDTRPIVLRRFAGAIDVIEVALQFDRAIYRSPGQWHAKLFDLFIEGQIGTIFTLEDVLEKLMDHLPGSTDDMPAAAYWYLLFLHKRGYLRCELDDRGMITDLRVLADATHPPGTTGAMPSASALPDFPFAASNWWTAYLTPVPNTSADDGRP